MMKKIYLLFVLLVLVTGLAVAEWEEIVNKDLMAGTKSTVLANEAIEYQGALRAPILFVREDAVILHWGGYSLDRDTKQIVIRFGEEEPEIIDISLSTNYEAIFLGEEVIERLLAVEQVVAATTSATGRKMIALFEVEGLDLSKVRPGEEE